jgi:ribosomal protein S18 acetylase RimI-like enzyme
VRWLEKIARAGGIASIQLELRARNHGARRFYRQLGYEEVALLRGYDQQREDALRLVTTLRRSSVQDVEPGRGPLA